MARYPIGKQDFKSLREEGYLYVDKTMYIRELIEGSQIYFLSRPRRFGKSLFLSTLEYFFLGKRDLFKGLAIDSYNWDWEPFPVIRIDLNGTDYSEERSLYNKLTDTLRDSENRYGIIPVGEDISIRLKNLIVKLYEKWGKGVVVLIDEYEKPIVDLLDNPELMERNRNMLQGFYSVLKSLDQYLKFVFLTGVTKFGQMNVFSGLNNLRDISLDDRFGAICGITEEELIANFRTGIRDFAESHSLSSDEVISLLKKNYDGYHFSKKCPDIYNPYSLVTAFAEKETGSYWALSGTPSFLAKVLEKQNYAIDSLEGIYASRNDLLGIDNQFNDPVTLFYQTGYITIKAYDNDVNEFIMGYPNLEVEQAFFKYILPSYVNKDKKETNSLITRIRKAFNQGNPEIAMQAIQSFSAGIGYDLIEKVETERHFQSLMFMLCKLVVTQNIDVKSEQMTSDGRIDILITSPKYVYIIEIKRDQSAEEALSQIKKKEYYLPFKTGDRKVYLIGVNFSTEKKRIDNYVIKEI